MIFGLKIFSLPVPTRPATRTFCHYPTRSRPEVKNHYPSVSGHNNFHDEMKVSVFMDDIWDFIAMINNSLHFRFSIIAMKKEIIFSVLPFMSMIILFKHDPQSLIAMNRII